MSTQDLLDRCTQELARTDLALAAAKAELSDERLFSASLLGAIDLLEGALRANADVERPEIAAILMTAAKARAGELLK